MLSFHEACLEKTGEGARRGAAKARRAKLAKGSGRRVGVLEEAR